MTESVARLTTALAGRYRIERELGAGGMATVYLAHDLRHERDVAIKVLHPDLGAALGGERFLSEIRTTARLQHPHILPLLDSGEADGLLYYVMPLVTGETLRARLEREGQLPMVDALRIAREAADALGYAHGLDIVHRDVKPENILLQGGHAIVADFGIALAVQSAGGQRMTQTGLSLGTPQYMAPEQAMGERKIDARADIYALGAVTYEMLTGDAPFTGSSAQAIVARVLTEKPRSICAVRDTVTANVEQAVLRALSKLPADRFGRVEEFAAALAAHGLSADMNAIATNGGTARSTMANEPGRTVRYSRYLMAALVLTTVASLAVAGWALARVPASIATAIFDAALPDSAPMSPVASITSTGFGAPAAHLSVAPRGDFIVYPVRHGDHRMLWRRSLVDASAGPIAGTSGGSTPRISPDGRRVAFISGNQTLVVPVGGGEARRLMESDPPATLEWVSPTRLFALHSDGYRLVWIDAEVGVVGERLLTGTRCVYGQWIAAERKLLCSFNETATLLDPESGELWPLRTEGEGGKAGRAVSGSAFRLVDGVYMIYLSLDGTLRGASYNGRTHQLGRPVSLVSGIRRDVLGAGQFDISASGLLGYAPAGAERLAAMVVLREGAEAVPLPLERAAFLRFDLSRDGRRLAAVVATPEGDELRIYDLRSGLRQVWLRAPILRMPLWSPRGDRIVIRVEDDAGAALLLGSPDATGAPDTLMRRVGEQDAFDALDFHDDSTILAREARTASVYRLTLTARSVRVDTLSIDAFFMSISPDGKRLAWHTSMSNQLFTGPYPPGSQRLQLAAGGVEPLWLSPTELLFRSNVTWFKARFDPASGALTGPPSFWARDTRFLDTPGWSNRPSWDGGIIYSQSAEQSDVRYLRFIPDFVTRLKAAVDGAAR
jgi:eukaryotic-like serine/threonine-protein kinase